MALRLPEHSHCKYCGDPIPFGKDYCNEICENALHESEKAEKRKDNLFFIGAAASVVIIIGLAYIL